MFELLLTVFIVSNCGNSDFKTREYYTKHVRQNFNYYYPAIQLNKNDAEIWYRFKDLDVDYWSKVAKEFKEKQLKNINYVPWIGEKEGFNTYYWLSEVKPRLNIDVPLGQTKYFMNYRYATVIFCEDLIREEEKRGYEKVGEYLAKWWEEEQDFIQEKNHISIRELRYLEREKKQSKEPDSLDKSPFQ